MSILVTIAISVGTLVAGGLGTWFLTQTRSDAKQSTEIEHLKKQIEGFTATRQGAGENGMTPHQQVMHKLRSIETVVTAASEEQHEILLLLKEWDKHYWEKLIVALQESAAGNRDVARVTESLITLATSMKLGGGKPPTPGSSSG